MLKNLLKYHPELEYYLYTPKPPAIQPDLGQSTNNVHIRTGKAAIPALWRSYGIKKDLLADKINIYHGLSNEIPVGINKTGIKTIVTIHDLIFKRYPEFYDTAERKIYDLKFRYACEKADAIVAISQSTANDIEEYYGIPESKIHIIYQACDDVFYEAPSNEFTKTIVNKYNLPDEYMLYVGSVSARKNLLRVLEAMVLNKDKIKLPLIIVGSGGVYQKKVIKFIHENKLEDRVHLLRGVLTAELPVFYCSALLFIYPSYYEGLGLPIAEALLSGTPVIAANTSSLMEAGGPHSRYVNPGNAEEMAEAILSIGLDSRVREKMAAEGHEYIKRFDRKFLTDEIVSLYRKMKLT